MPLSFCQSLSVALPRVALDARGALARLSGVRWTIALLGLAAVACHRAAEEPPAERTPVAELASAKTPSRCVSPTPRMAPTLARPIASNCPPDPAPHTLESVVVRFPEAESDAGEVKVVSELARRDADRERGLMFRTSLAEDAGMLFDFGGTREVHTFWMRNTCVPLDMIFLDDDGFIVGIVENAKTLDDTPRSVPCPSAYVLEVNAGWARRHFVRAGQRALLPGA